MEIYTCDDCKKIIEIEYGDKWSGKCECGCESFDVERVSGCCGASEIGETGLCSCCKEYGF